MAIGRPKVPFFTFTESLAWGTATIWVPEESPNQNSYYKLCLALLTDLSKVNARYFFLNLDNKAIPRVPQSYEYQKRFDIAKKILEKLVVQRHKKAMYLAEIMDNLRVDNAPSADLMEKIAIAVDYKARTNELLFAIELSKTKITRTEFIINKKIAKTPASPSPAIIRIMRERLGILVDGTQNPSKNEEKTLDKGLVEKKADPISNKILSEKKSLTGKLESTHQSAITLLTDLQAERKTLAASRLELSNLGAELQFIEESKIAIEKEIYHQLALNFKQLHLPMEWLEEEKKSGEDACAVRDQLEEVKRSIYHKKFKAQQVQHQTQKKSEKINSLTESLASSLNAQMDRMIDRKIIQIKEEYKITDEMLSEEVLKGLEKCAIYSVQVELTHYRMITLQRVLNKSENFSEEYKANLIAKVEECEKRKKVEVQLEFSACEELELLAANHRKIVNILLYREPRKYSKDR